MVGLVRRLDALGRIVIPGEYRRRFGIAPGDPMEICAQANGDVVVRKVNFFTVLTETSMPAVTALSEELNKPVFVSNLLEFICGVGDTQPPIIKTYCPREIATALRSGKSLNTTTADDRNSVLLDCGYEYVAFAPIIHGGITSGGLFMFSDTPIRDDEFSVLKVTAQIISKTIPDL